MPSVWPVSSLFIIYEDQSCRILDPRIIINEPLEYTFMSNTQDAIKGLVRKNNLKKWGENNKEIVNLNLKKSDIFRLYRSVNETRIQHSRMYEFGRKRD